MTCEARCEAVGVDPTPAQLATTCRMQAETGIAFPLVEAPAEAVPLLDAGFDLALSEYGASLWADPAKWIPEAGRLLRPGGRLVFLTNSILVYLCAPDVGAVSEQLQRPQFGMGRIQWPGEVGIEYHLPHGEWIRILRDTGFEVEALHELRPHEAAVDPTYTTTSRSTGRGAGPPRRSGSRGSARSKVGTLPETTLSQLRNASSTGAIRRPKLRTAVSVVARRVSQGPVGSVPSGSRR